MLQPELKFRRDKIRSLMVSQGIDAALITCNANLIYTYGCVVSGYLYLPLHSPALLFFKRPNNITGEHSFSIRKPEQIVDLLKEQGLPMPTKLMSLYGILSSGRSLPGSGSGKWYPVDSPGTQRENTCRN